MCLTYTALSLSSLRDQSLLAITIEKNKMEGNNAKEEQEQQDGKPPPSQPQIIRPYQDYSNHSLPDDRKKRGRVTFPMKLHAILSNPAYKHISCWMPHGRSWKVLDKELMASVVCQENFNHDSYGSFSRSVNGWGFTVSLLFD